MPNASARSRCRAPSLTQPPSELEKAYAECSILESLEHPHIVKMYEWFQTDKKIFIFMELARDGTVSAFAESYESRILPPFFTATSLLRRLTLFP